MDGPLTIVHCHPLLLLTRYIGTISLVVENFSEPKVWKVTAVFGSIVVFFGVAALLIGACGDDSSWFGAATASIFGVVPGFMLVLGAFYCDWILAALAGNLVGVPSGDTAVLYWVSTLRDTLRGVHAD